MIRLYNLLDNPEVVLSEQGGPFQVIEWKHDLDLDQTNAQSIYFLKKLGERHLPKRRRQLVCALGPDHPSITLQAGDMAYFAGAIEMTTGLKGVGDFAKKMFSGRVTGESAIKPVYSGDGVLVTEPTFQYLFVEDLAHWPQGMVITDGMFAACESRIELSINARKNFSTAAAGNEGIFNLCLRGKGFAVFESPVPREDLICFELENDVIRIDGDHAICWSASLDFTVERSGKSLVGSAASGEGLVNVYRGTGRIWMRPF